jgi:hypothetical protein
MFGALMNADRLDHVKGDEEVSAPIDDLLVSPGPSKGALQSDELLVQPELRYSGADRSGGAGRLRCAGARLAPHEPREGPSGVTSDSTGETFTHGS